VFGSEAKLAGKGCQTYALRVSNPFSFFECRETKKFHIIIVVSGFFSLVPNGTLLKIVRVSPALLVSPPLKT